MAFVCEEVEQIEDKLLPIGADDLSSVTMSALKMSNDEFGTTMKVGAICNIIVAKIDMQEIQNTNDLQMFFDNFFKNKIKG